MEADDCAVDGCDKPARTRRLCNAHYIRHRKGQDLTRPVRERRPGPQACEVEGCAKPSHRYRRCTTHDNRVQKGLPLADPVRQWERSGVCVVSDCGRRRVDSARFCTRHGRLHSRYGIPPEHYDVALARQGGRCAICRRPDSGRSGRESFCVDHDHACCPGKTSCGRCIRGLLCDPCNTAIGMLGDDPTVLDAAAQYLRAARQSQLFIA